MIQAEKAPTIVLSIACVLSVSLVQGCPGVNSFFLTLFVQKQIRYNVNLMLSALSTSSRARLANFFGLAI